MPHGERFRSLGRIYHPGSCDLVNSCSDHAPLNIKPENQGSPEPTAYRAQTLKMPHPPLCVHRQERDSLGFRDSTWGWAGGEGGGSGGNFICRVRFVWAARTGSVGSHIQCVSQGSVSSWEAYFSNPMHFSFEKDSVIIL